MSESMRPAERAAAIMFGEIQKTEDNYLAEQTALFIKLGVMTILENGRMETLTEPTVFDNMIDSKTKSSEQRIADLKALRALLPEEDLE